MTNEYSSLALVLGVTELAKPERRAGNCGFCASRLADDR
jgi:hypothetical protein